MKYVSKVKSEQTIQIDGGRAVVIQPGSGEMTDKEAVAVAKTPWGKRLIETEYLKFDKKIEIKDEKVERGMTVDPKKIKPQKGGEKPPENIPDFDRNGGAA